jgi:hypothetical protein
MIRSSSGVRVAFGPATSHEPSGLLDSHWAAGKPGGPETHDEFDERIRREQQVAARLRLATERLELAGGWIWTGLSPS